MKRSFTIAVIKLEASVKRPKGKPRQLGFWCFGINRGKRRRGEDGRCWVSCCAEGEVNRGNMRKYRGMMTTTAWLCDERKKTIKYCIIVNRPGKAEQFYKHLRI